MVEAAETNKHASLDGLRAVAVTLVVLHHLAQFPARSYATGSVGNLLFGFGRLGVVVFMVLSGFVIWLPIARAIAAGEPLPSPGKFLVRRLVRIFPAYWIALVGLHAFVDDSHLNSTNEALTHAFLLQNFQHGAVFRGILVGWTLAIEMTFYLSVGVAIVVMSRISVARRPLAQRILVATMLLAPYAVRWWLLYHTNLDRITVGRWWTIAAIPVALPWWTDTFGAGMLLAALAVRYHSGRRRGAAYGDVALLILVAAMLYVETLGFFGSFDAAGSRTAAFWDMPVRVVGAAGVVLLLVGAQAPRAVRVLSVPRWCWIGTISYGIYLWHDGIIREVDRVRALESSLVLPVLIAVGLTVVVAATSWYLVERPLLDRVRRAQRGAAVTEQPTTIARPSAR